MKGKSPTAEEATRIEAYLLSEKAGHPGGMESYFWEQAKAIVQARKTVVAVAVKKAAKVKVKAKAEAKPAAKAKAKAPAPVEVKAATKPKAAAAAKKPASERAPSKELQLPLNGETRHPARSRAAKK